ncbi:transporter [Gilvimarinus sp. SDUM040013]|uniref:Transporter n=1 Tax=Gilvimarinus gilvus TaxID=3058038 RepID=A0ABU4RUU2_9GAMM|nr:transporter [Gilvimarinus sp. SDUM040013]MDO3388483.1 transporter [Gilvimarinus sp. SDUM040013]MDX6848645.1 transporter [Gilvimarinus sp. SDUM040013]
MQSMKNVPLFAGLVIACSGQQSLAQEPTAAELAKKLSNPVAALISVPFQLNYDTDIGPDDTGDRVTLNVQPVIPIDLNENWNVISRTILPITDQQDIFAGAGSQSGIGDVVQSVFFSPKAPTDSGWILGAGPVMLLPTGSDDMLSAKKWGLGPTAVALKQTGHWTYGALTNHIESVAGDDDRADISATFLQPFLSYSTSTGVSYTVNSETTYDWEADQATVPVNFMVNKIGKIGGQMIQYGGGVRYWLDSPDNGPEGFGFRMNFVLLFPR